MSLAACAARAIGNSETQSTDFWSLTSCVLSLPATGVSTLTNYSSNLLKITRPCRPARRVLYTLSRSVQALRSKPLAAHRRGDGGACIIHTAHPFATPRFHPEIAAALVAATGRALYTVPVPLQPRISSRNPLLSISPSGACIIHTAVPFASPRNPPGFDPPRHCREEARIIEIQNRLSTVFYEFITERWN